MQKKQSSRRNRRPNRHIDPVVFGVASLIAAVVLVAIVAIPQYVSKEARLDVLRGHVGEIGQIAASVVDGDLHRQLLDPANYSDELYDKAVAPLVRLHSADPDIFYLNTMVERGGDPYFVLDTAASFGFGGPRVAPDEDVERLVRYYQNVGIFMNEMNRAMGLIDYVPKVLNPAVVEKMRFIHAMVGEACRRATAAPKSEKKIKTGTPGEDRTSKNAALAAKDSEWHDVHPDADTVASAAEDDPFDRADVAVVATPGERDV